MIVQCFKLSLFFKFQTLKFRKSFYAIRFNRKAKVKLINLDTNVEMIKVMQKLGVYLLGRMTDLPDNGKRWRDEYFNILSNEIDNIEYIGPINKCDEISIVRQDVIYIQRSDIIIINATIPFILGGPMELLLSKYYNKLTITVLNETNSINNCYENHPWLRAFSDYIVKSMDELIDIIKRYNENPKNIKIKLWEEILDGED